MKLIEFLKERNAKSVKKVTGPNGAFLSIIEKDGEVTTMPIGKKSQDGTLSEYNVLIADEDGQAIATINNYQDGETMEL